MKQEPFSVNHSMGPDSMLMQRNRFSTAVITRSHTSSLLMPSMVATWDNDMELTSNTILKWQQNHAVEWHHIAPDKPTQNGFMRASTDACAMNAAPLHQLPPC